MRLLCIIRVTVRQMHDIQIDGYELVVTIQDLQRAPNTLVLPAETPMWLAQANHFVTLQPDHHKQGDAVVVVRECRHSARTCACLA